jgi:hypothetical protein
MPQITAGKVSFARSVQPAQYETKKAEVELSFSLAEGEELGAWLDDVAAKAQAKALEMVGLKPAQEAKHVSVAKAQPKSKDVLDAEIAKAEVQEKQKAKEAYAAKQRVGEDLEAAKKLAEKSNTAKVPVDSLMDLAENTNGQGLADPDADLLADVPKEVSDQDLVAAVTRKNQELKDPKKIHALRETFVKLPKGLRDIPAADRPRFLAELEALKK